jgi:hypothetical protein
MRQATLGILVALAILTSAAHAVHAQEFEPRFDLAFYLTVLRSELDMAAE